MAKTMEVWMAAMFLALAAGGPAAAARARPPVEEMVRQLDGLYRGTASRGEMRMTVETPDWKRTMDMDIWSEGMDKTFVVIRSPAKDAGVATLRVKRDMWDYFPRINKTLKVPPSMMMGSWMGSDFTNDDLVRESSYLDDYDARWVGPEEGATWTLELTPKARTATVWGKISVTLQAGTPVPLEEDYFDEHGKKVRVMKFSDIQQVGGRTLPLVMEMIPLEKPGNRTQVTYRSLEFDVDLDPSVFSLQNLRQAR